MLDVEVFPVAHDRWIAVIKNPAGEFSAESSSPREVPAAVHAALVEVLGDTVPEHRLVDANGLPWDLTVATQQAAALER